MRLIEATALLAGILAIAAGGPTAAQHHVITQDQTAKEPASPYAGMQDRLVKALSDQQIADLKSGRGMGLALVAELNGYPGPLHVLELADALQLTHEQQVSTQELFDAMKGETIPIGEQIIADEIRLDGLFAKKRVTSDSLEEATARIGIAQGALRRAHLRYHLAMIDLLTPVQIVRYAELRGYASKAGHLHE